MDKIPSQPRSEVWPSRGGYYPGSATMPMSPEMPVVTPDGRVVRLADFHKPAESVIRVYWFGKWHEVRNYLFQGLDVPPFDPDEKPTSGDFRRFNTALKEATR